MNLKKAQRKLSLKELMKMQGIEHTILKANLTATT